MFFWLQTFFKAYNFIHIHLYKVDLVLYDSHSCHCTDTFEFNLARKIGGKQKEKNKEYLCGAEDNQLDSLSALHSSHSVKEQNIIPWQQFNLQYGI